MKNKKIRLNYKGKKFNLNLKVCKGISEVIGLMFTKKENARALLFEFEKPVRMRIHSYFVFFSFIAIWLDTDGKVIDLKIVKPFKFSLRPKKSFSKLIEIPLNKKYAQITQFLVNTRKI